MDVHGSIAQNLKAAVQSSRRLKGHPIHKDTLQFWLSLVREARSRRAAGDIHECDRSAVDEAIVELEVVLADTSS